MGSVNGMKSVIIASGNTHKRDKLSWIVDGYFEPMDMPEPVEVDENGATFEENARIKASAVAKQFGKYAIATDAGALIPSLGDKWNSLLTRRFLGKEDVDDWDRIDGLLELMKDKKGDDRKVIWREAIAVSDPVGTIIFSTEVEGDTGLIQASYKKEQYREGIWLCTLTSYPQFGGKNFFELNEEETKEGEISWWKLKEKFADFFNTADRDTTTPR